MRLYELVLSIPHASTYIPDDIRALMPHRDEVLFHEPDLYTDRIYNIRGPKIVEAPISRLISDVNRAPDEMYTKGKARATGVIILSLSSGEDVFAKDPSFEMMQKWIDTYHRPFHDELDRALSGAKFLIDCHSMWSVAPASRSDAGTPRPDVVLGNRFYTTCDAATTKFFRDAFEQRGRTVVVNHPFIGRYVIGTHCSRKKTPGIQIELCRKLYMDEQSLEPFDEHIEELNREFLDIVEAFCAWDEGRERDSQLCDLSMHR